MATSPCVSCGRPADPAKPCPYCGHDPLVTELSLLDRDLAEMSAQDVRLQRELKDLSAKMQAAQHQRVLLSHTLANAEQQQRRSTPRSVLRRRPTSGPGGAGRRTPPPPPRDTPRQGTTTAPRPPRQQPPGRREKPAGRPPPPSPSDGPRPEASSASVQDILLILGALLLAVAAVVFGVVASGVLDSGSRAVILLLATALTLAVPRMVAGRGLVATAETICAVGLLLLPVDGYTLWTIDRLGLQALPGPLFAGLVSAATVVVAAVYMTLSGLTVPRFAIVLAIQPVLPLLAYHWISGPAGWALVLAAVAAVDAALGGMLSLTPPATPPEPAAPGQVAQPAQADEAGRNRPQPAPSATAAQAHLAMAAATFWLRELTWVMHALALGGGLVYAAVSLLTADSVPAALRSAATMLAAAAVGVYAALQLRRRPLPDVAAGLMTLALIVSAARVSAVALPGRSLVLIAAAVALAGVGVRSLPGWARRGPSLASSLALAVMGAVVAASTARTAVATIRSALPMWDADLSAQPRLLADAVGRAEWQLVAAALALTAAAYLALPAGYRREGAVAGVAIAALAAPASLGLSWTATPWLLVAAAVAIGATGLSARTERAAAAHTAAAGLVGLVGGGAALARPALMALVLAAITLAGVLIAVAERFTGGGGLRSLGRAPGVGVTGVLGGWAAGGASFALPGAVAAGVATVADTATPVLITSYLAVCVTLGYAALDQVAHRQVSVPIAVGSGLGAVAVATAAFRTADKPADLWVAALLLAGAILLFLAPSIDATRRADRNLDGPDIAAGVVTAATVASLARVGALALPGSGLATTAALVLLVALWARALPEDWRRGPILGGAACGAVVGAIAGYAALRDGIRVLGLRGDIWAADLGAWPGVPGGETHWQTPVALLLLAAAAAVVLPRPASYDVAAVGVGLATVGAPLALDLAWWSPIALGGVVAIAYAISSVIARDPRAGVTRAVLATALALHAAGAGLVRPWTTAVALGGIAVLGAVVATLAVLVARLDLGIVDDSVPGATNHLPIVGGAAVTSALLALPGAFVAVTAELDRPAGAMLTAALGASSLGLAVIATVRRQVPHYLGFATAGVAGGATITAIAALPSDQPAGLYAAAAVLLGVIAELQRAESVGSDGRGGETSSWRSTAASGPFFSSLSSGSHGAQRMAEGMVQVSDGMLRRWRIGPVRQLSISPIRGALMVSALPTALALAMIVPALVTALVDPYQTLHSVWHGAPPALLEPATGDPGSVLAALLLTIAAALAAIGFSGGSPAQAIPVVLPGLAITLLITPVAFGADWPASTLACLAVFTISSLGVALSPPPPYTDQARPVRVARVLVFFIGLSAGGAGLAGSLATRSLTLFTLGGAVCVGATAALGGRTRLSRVLGWLFFAASAQGFVLTLGRVLGLPGRVCAFGVLGVGAVLLVTTATLPRLRRPESYQETATVEWSGHAAALLALALAINSPLHVAALLAAWGAVLGLAATRPNRRPTERRTLFWATVGCEIAGWWLLMGLSDVALIEAYTVPFAALALLVGVLEARHRPDLSSWAAYGPALVAAFLPTLTVVLFSSAGAPRQVGLLLGAVAVLIAGSVRRQQAPVMVGAIVTAITALRLLTEYGPWLILIPVGLTLLVLGANYEKRRRDIQRLRATLTSFR